MPRSPTLRAKGAGAFGTFTVTRTITRCTKAKVFAEIGKTTEMFARFSTVAGERSAADAERDIRGFAYRINPLKATASYNGANARTTETRGDDEKVDLTCIDRDIAGSHDVELEGSFLQIGLMPNAGWLKGAMTSSRFAEGLVDAKSRTTLLGLFTTGNSTVAPNNQITAITGEGTRSPLSALDHLSRTQALDLQDA